MNNKIGMWECECGGVEYREYPPEECPKCWKINSFLEVPEDLRSEIDEENVLEKMREEDLEEEDD
jgi:hypothetical protein